MSIKKVSVVTPNGEHTIMTSRPKAVRAVITVRQQVMKHVRVYRFKKRVLVGILVVAYLRFLRGGEWGWSFVFSVLSPPPRPFPYISSPPFPRWS